MHILLLLALLACVARDTSASERVQSAINVLTDVGDPACELAKQTCLLRQDLALAQAEDGDRSKVEVFKRITLRCEVVMDTCDQMRRAQREAADLVEDGMIEAAEAEVARVRDAWRGLSLDAEDAGAPWR